MERPKADIEADISPVIDHQGRKAVGLISCVSRIDRSVHGWRLTPETRDAVPKQIQEQDIHI